MKRMLIRFRGDNDFGWLMMEVGQAIKRLKNYGRRDNPPTKEEVAHFFNSTATAFYFLFRENSITPHYLEIEPETSIFIDDEVDAKMLSYDSWGNGDSVYIDFENDQIQII